MGQRDLLRELEERLLVFVSIDNSFKEFCYKGEKTKEVLTGKIEVSRFFCLLLSLDEKNVCQWPLFLELRCEKGGQNLPGA